MNRPLLIALTTLFTLLFYSVATGLGVGANYAFIGCALIMFSVYPPVAAGSALMFLFVYYFLFYGLGSFGSRYNDLSFSHEAVIFVYMMALTTLGIGVFAMSLCDSVSFREIKRTKREPLVPPFLFLLLMLGVLAATLFNFIYATGGIGAWIENPGRTFIGREGAGLAYVAFNYCAYLVAGFLGIYAARRSRLWPYAVVVGLAICLAPFLGSKQKLLLMVMIGFAPVFYYARVLTVRAAAIGVVALSCFLAINIIRNSAWITWDHFSPWCCGNEELGPTFSPATTGVIDFNYAGFRDVTNQSVWAYNLNYFDVVENAVIAVQDFQPREMFTVALPFNKLTQLQGQVVAPEDYDMSFYLTSVYYPWIYELKGSTQWPIEIDLYLSFGYPDGWIFVPFLLGMFLFFGLIHRVACCSKSVAWAQVAVFFSGYLITHLRGGLVYWTDFYVLPTMVLMLIVLRIFEGSFRHQ